METPPRRRHPGFVTVIVDLTPNVDGTGPARLLDMVPGRSAEVLRRWLAAREKSFRDRVKVVAMDGFAGYHTATTEQLPTARKVMDPFHVVHLAADKLTVTRQRIQQDTCGHRGRSGDLLYGVRRILLTRMGLLTDKQKAKLDAVFADERHTAVDVTHWVYQDIIAAYEHPDRRVGKRWMYKVMCRIRKGHPGRGPGARPAGPDNVETPGRDPRVLRYRRIQWSGRGDQRTARAPARHRTGFQESQPLHLAVTDPLRTAAGQDQRTLNPEGPPIPAHAEDLE